MKKIFVLICAVSMMFVSCGAIGGSNTSTDTDTTTISVDNIETVDSITADSVTVSNVVAE